MGRWDRTMKQLFGLTPQDFVSWLVPEAELIHELPEELHSRDIETDKLCRIMYWRPWRMNCRLSRLSFT